MQHRMAHFPLDVYNTLENIRRWLLNFIFNEHLLGAIDPEAATPGYRGARDFLFRECEHRFPQYNTLITSNIWQDNLVLYRRVLAERTLAERRGIEPIKGLKAEIAALFGQRNHAGFDSKMRVQYPFLLDITWTGERGTLLFTPHPIESRVLVFLGDEGRVYDEVVELCRAEGYAREEVEEICALLVTRGQIKEEAGRIYKTDTLSIPELRRLGEELIVELQALEAVLPRKDLEVFLAVAQSLAALDADNETGRQKGHAQLILLTESMAKLRACARLAFLDVLEREKGEIGVLLRSLDELVPGFSGPVSFKNHLDGVRKLLEEDALSMRRSSARLRETIHSVRNQGLRLEDAEIGAFLVEVVDRLQQSHETLRGLQTRFELYQQRIGLLKQWISWGAHFVRLKQNISNLVSQLKDVEPVSTQLARVLDTIENEVRESLSHNGLATLDQIGHVQRLLDDVTKEYDRNLAEREMAFEKEKSALEALIASITDSEKSLRSKYQISKHEESYRDLYLEALQVAQEVFASLDTRVQLLDARLQSIRGKGTRGNSAAIDSRAIRALVRKVTEGQKLLLNAQETERVLHYPLIEDFVESLIKLRKQLDEAERKIPLQASLSLNAGTLLAKLNIEPKDLRTLIDVRAAMLGLPSDSDLTALLELCLIGDVVVEVHRKVDLIQTDNE